MGLSSRDLCPWLSHDDRRQHWHDRKQQAMAGVCPDCHAQMEIAKYRIGGNVRDPWKLVYYCATCARRHGSAWSNGKGGHAYALIAELRDITDPDTLSACTRCGQVGNCHQHHPAHVHIFGREEADTFGTIPYCEPCHTKLHARFYQFYGKRP